ncbi:MAG: TIGR03747 family integrating conjugative element membrane protein [Gammaproteobacteria bacterium]|nr:TIGR03747 family integrating conjugative element membrane protein [Gammaproteobacteria bacterium]
MGSEAAADPRRREVRQGLLSTLLTTVAQGIKWLILSLVFSVIIEWVGMVFWWPDEGLEHSRDMLAAEIGYLQADFGRSLVSSDPAQFTKTVADQTYYVLFEFTRVADFIEWVASAPVPGESGLRSRLHGAFQPVAEYVLAAMQVTQVFSVRLAVLALAMPVFVMFTLVAIVDGLVKRDLRRWGGGRESSFVYHWAKRSALPLLVLTWVIYLALPFSLHPSFVVLPFATLFALSVAVTASSFKKYL